MKLYTRSVGRQSLLIPVFWMRGRGYRVEVDSYTSGGWLYGVRLSTERLCPRGIRIDIRWGRWPIGTHFEV